MLSEKGHVPWNKGKKVGSHSEETKKKMSKRHKEIGTGMWMKGRKLSDEVKKKMSETQKKRFKTDPNHSFKIVKKGKDHPCYDKPQTEETKQKISNTLKGKMVREKNPFYGRRHTEKSKQIMSKKLKKRFANKENTPWYGKKRSEETRNKIKQKLKGIKLSNEIKRKMRLSAINRINKQKGQMYPSYNKNSCEIFSFLNTKFNIDGFYAENGGEYLIKKFGYFVDYYEPKLNIVIEWDEINHYDCEGILKEQDIIREIEIMKYLKCDFFRIREDQNINDQISYIESQIEKLIINISL